MTENKRFTMCYEQNDINGWTMSIVDWETKEPFNYTTYEVHSNSITDTKDEMEDLCLLLNELNDENEQLKQGLNDDLELIGQLQEENKQLKQELIEFKKWGKYVGDVKKEDLDKVFKMSIYEIAEAFTYYEKRIKELEE